MLHIGQPSSADLCHTPPLTQWLAGEREVVHALTSTPPLAIVKEPRQVDVSCLPLHHLSDETGYGVQRQLPPKHYAGVA